MQVHATMGPRDPEESHRVSTPLELFFDLTFVIAVSQAASGLHHGLVEGHAGNALVAFPMMFFAIWWAWMNFTWFASAYDTEDVVYRVAVFVQMIGVLVLAAGIPRAFDERDFAVTVLGYVIMRFAMVGQWLRAAASHPAGRAVALRYAGGIAGVQVLWIVRLALPDGIQVASFVVLAVAEMTVPVWAERAARTSWHPHHIVERYGLFTIIVLGETLLAATVGVQAALDADTRLGDLAGVIVGGLLIVFSMWWIYFDMPTARLVHQARESFAVGGSAVFVWGYGHYFVFGAAAATGAGLAVAVDQAVGETELSTRAAAFAATVPVLVFIVAAWLLHFRAKRPGALRSCAIPGAAVAILVVSFTGEAVLLTGIVMAAVVGISVIANSRQPVDQARSMTASISTS